METMVVSLTKIRLQWVGHVHRLDDRLITRQDGKSWSDTVTEYLQNIDMTCHWAGYGEIADDRALCRSCVARPMCSQNTRKEWD